MLSAFVRSPIGAEEACHDNHDRKDNRLANLHWGSRRDNEAEKTRSGRRPATTVGRLTASDAAEIRGLFKAGISRREIARRFNTHHTNVWLITKGRTWQQ